MMPAIFKKLVCLIQVFVFTVTSVILPSNLYAQSITSPALTLPAVGEMVNISKAYTPVLLKGLTMDQTDPLKFEFLMDQGDSDLQGEDIKSESYKLIKYFMASMTVPEEDLWVNLPPYEKDRIIPDSLGQTEMGRDLLSQDYILKQLTATLMSPEGETGRKFWDKIYAQANEAGISDVPVDTFNKIWIVPQTGYFYEYNNSVLITDAKLKVMLEEDFVAAQKTMGVKNYGLDSYHKPGNTEEVKQIIRSVIIPVIEQEVNEGEHFAPLRQVYNAMLLAVWFKKRIKSHILSEVYVDQRKVSGIDLNNPNTNEAIWNQYVETFKSGVSNAIQEEYDPVTQSIVPRKYFVGGLTPLGVNNAQMATQASWRDLGKKPFSVLFGLQTKIRVSGKTTMFGAVRNAVLAILFVFLFTHNASGQDLREIVDGLRQENKDYVPMIVGRDSLGREFILMKSLEFSQDFFKYKLFWGSQYYDVVSEDAAFDANKEARENELGKLGVQKYDEEEAAWNEAEKKTGHAIVPTMGDTIPEDLNQRLLEIDQKYKALSQKLTEQYPVDMRNSSRPILTGFENLRFDSPSGVIYVDPNNPKTSFLNVFDGETLEGTLVFGGNVIILDLNFLTMTKEEIKYQLEQLTDVEHPDYQGEGRQARAKADLNQFISLHRQLGRFRSWNVQKKHEEWLGVLENFMERVPFMNKSDFEEGSKEIQEIMFFRQEMFVTDALRALHGDNAQMAITKQVDIKLILLFAGILLFVNMGRAQIGNHNAILDRLYEQYTKSFLKNNSSKWTARETIPVAHGLLERYKNSLVIPHWGNDMSTVVMDQANGLQVDRLKWVFGEFDFLVRESVARLRQEFPKISEYYSENHRLPTVSYDLVDTVFLNDGGRVWGEEWISVTFPIFFPSGEERKPGRVCQYINVGNYVEYKLRFEPDESGSVYLWVKDVFRDLLPEEVFDNAQMADVKQLNQRQDANTTTGGVNLRSDQADIQIQADGSSFKFPKYDPTMPMMPLQRLTPMILDLKFITIQDAAMKLGLVVPENDSSDEKSFSLDNAKEQELATL